MFLGPKARQSFPKAAARVYGGAERQASINQVGGLLGRCPILLLCNDSRRAKDSPAFELEYRLQASNCPDNSSSQPISNESHHALESI